MISAIGGVCGGDCGHGPLGPLSLSVRGQKAFMDIWWVTVNIDWPLRLEFNKLQGYIPYLRQLSLHFNCGWLVFISVCRICCLRGGLCRQLAHGRDWVWCGLRGGPGSQVITGPKLTSWFFRVSRRTWRRVAITSANIESGP